MGVQSAGASELYAGNLMSSGSTGARDREATVNPAPSSSPGKTRFRWGPAERITRDISIYTRAMLCSGGVLACAGVAGPAIGGAPGGPRGVHAPMHKVSSGGIVSRGRDDRALDRLGS